jgi:hypothetical protein
MFVGATGPFVAALLAPRLDDRKRYVGTHAMAMVMQHSLKVVVFGFLGFAFGAWVPLMARWWHGRVSWHAAWHAACCMPCRRRLSAPRFKWLLTLLALQLIASAAWSWLG